MYRKGYSKVFFEKTSTQNYFSALHRKMEEEVENMSNATISSCDFHEWVEYLSNKYYILPISIFETNIEKKIVETKVRKRNPFHNALGSRNITSLTVYVLHLQSRLMETQICLICSPIVLF